MGALPLSFLASSSLCDPDSATASDRLRFCGSVNRTGRWGAKDRDVSEARPCLEVVLAEQRKRRRTTISSRFGSSASTLRFLLPSFSLSRSGDRGDRPPVLIIISGGSVADKPRSSRTVLLKRVSPCRTSCADLILVLVAGRREASPSSPSSGSAPNERSDLFLPP